MNESSYLDRVQAALLGRHGCSLLVDLARRSAGGDIQGVRERVRFLETPRQRFLTVSLREAGGTLAQIGSFLDDLRERRKDLASPTVAAELAAIRPAAARLAERFIQKGRIP